MDTVVIRYEKLFSIQLDHSDFPPMEGMNGAVALADHLEVVPDEKTKQLFGVYDIQYRLNQDVLVCYLRVLANEDRPFHPLPTNFSVRFLIHASASFTAGLGVPNTFGRDRVYYIPIELKAAASAAVLDDSLLSTVTDTTPTPVFHPGYPGYWERRVTTVSGCLGVIDLLTQGAGANRLFVDEATQLLNYTEANGKAREHLYRITFKP